MPSSSSSRPSAPPPSSSPFPPSRRPSVAFLHLDLGIGGAEALVVALATTLLPPSPHPQGRGGKEARDLNSEVSSSSSGVYLYTTKCDQSHCFSQLKLHSVPPGVLSSSVFVRGRFLPSSLFGLRFSALLSNVRVCYLALCLSFDCWYNSLPLDAIVLDVLPSPMPLLRVLLPSVPILYYCHFPDKLLVRNCVNGIEVSKASFLRSLYRLPLDALEEFATSFADVVAVNSRFTKGVFEDAFRNIKDCIVPEVLYPAINLKDFVPPKDPAAKLSDCKKCLTLVSLNRFERKKNIGLCLRMLSRLRSLLPPSTFATLHLVIAGGYDPSNAENVAHLTELLSLSKALDLESQVTFRPSISDADRAALLQQALLVLYTPAREHFGIVPLEAMYAGSAVLAVASGGPLETVVDGETGFLCDDDEKAFAEKVAWCVGNVEKTVEMGTRGHEHVKGKFGMDKFEAAFHQLLKKTIEEGKRKRSGRCFRALLLIAVVVAVMAWAARFFMARYGHNV